MITARPSDVITDKDDISWKMEILETNCTDNLAQHLRSS